MTDHHENWPTPGSNRPVPQWDEYERLEQAIHDYLNHEPDDPRWNDIWRALGSILGEYHRDRFVDAFDLAEPAEMPCIRRLITGEDECTCHERGGWQERELEQIGARDDPPHAPPHHDHATLWVDEDGEPAVYSMHVYPGNVEQITPSKTADPDQQRRNGWMDICNWTAEWGLEVGFLAKSWYNLGSAVHVVFYPPERYRSES